MQQLDLSNKVSQARTMWEILSSSLKLDKGLRAGSRLSFKYLAIANRTLDVRFTATRNDLGFEIFSYYSMSLKYHLPCSAGGSNCKPVRL